LNQVVEFFEITILGSGPLDVISGIFHVINDQSLHLLSSLIEIYNYSGII